MHCGRLLADDCFTGQDGRKVAYADDIPVSPRLASAEIHKNVRDPETRTDRRNQGEQPNLTVLAPSSRGPQD